MMKRRHLIKTGLVSIASAVGVAGCSGGGGTESPEYSREVEADEEDVSLSEWSAGVEDADGEQAFVVEVTAENVSDRDYYMTVSMEFLDGEGTVLDESQSNFPSANEQLEQGESTTVRMGTTESPSEVRQYAVTVQTGL